LETGPKRTTIGCFAKNSDKWKVLIRLISFISLVSFVRLVRLIRLKKFQVLLVFSSDPPQKQIDEKYFFQEWKK